MLAKIFANLVGVASHWGFAIPSANEIEYLFTNVLEVCLVQESSIYLETRTPFSSLYKHLWNLDEILIL